MRCLGSLSACVIGPLLLTAGTATFLASLACLTLGARDWAENGQRATRDAEDTARPAGAAGRPQTRRPRSRARS